MVSEEKKKKHMMTLIKRYRSTAITHKKKADRLWAYAKNDKGDYNYDLAKEFYRRAKECEEKADSLEEELKSL